VVATAAGGPLEIITDGVDGLLVAPGDVSALADALNRLLDDPDLRKEFGNAGMRRALDFSPEHIGETVDAIYRDLLAAPRR
jgi:glycosyltransferase involved in cell wall biosynthesis